MDDDAATGSRPDSPAFRPWLGVYLKGVAMGTADAIPGVSGGTIALITGIYDRLVGAIASLDPRGVVRAVVTPRQGDGDPSRVRGVADELLAMDVHFLTVLGLGVLTGGAAVSQVLEVVLRDLPLPTFAFFFGLIAASAFVLRGEVSLQTPAQVVAAVVGGGGAFLLVGQFRAGLGHSLPVVFAVAVVAVSAMLLPGVSGSFLLLAFGQLHFMSRSVNEFLEGLLALADGGALARVTGAGTVVVTFAAGAVVGLLSVARIVRFALRHRRAATLTFLVFLMVGALRLPADEVATAAGTPTDWLVAVIAALVGGVLVVGLERATGEIGIE